MQRAQHHRRSGNGPWEGFRVSEGSTGGREKKMVIAMLFAVEARGSGDLVSSSAMGITGVVLFVEVIGIISSP